MTPSVRPPRADPIFALGLNLFLYLVAVLASRDVRRINPPGKDRLLELPAQSQLAVLAEVRAALELPCPQITVTFCLIQLSTYRAALGGDLAGAVTI